MLQYLVKLLNPIFKLCRKPRSHEGHARKGKKTEKKKEKTESKQQAEQGDGDSSDEVDESEQDMQILDFDKLMGTLKYEKKLVEISIPSAPATSESKVGTACNRTAAWMQLG